MYSPTYINGPFRSKLLINCDWTASGVPFKPIENFIDQIVYKYYSNTHSNSYTGQCMVNLTEQAKDIIRRETSAGSDYKVIFTGNGSTSAINLLIHSILPLIETCEEKVVIFLSVAEHHSNLLAWSHLKQPGFFKSHKIEIIIIPTDCKTGKIDLQILKVKLIQYQHYKIICSFTASSNVTGILMPVHQIASLVHQFKGLIFFDFASCASYVDIDVTGKKFKTSKFDSSIDAIFISPHKFHGGPGCPGLLIARQQLFQNKIPFLPGGGCVKFVCKNFVQYADDPEIYSQGGTPNIIGGIKTGLVFLLKAKNLSFIIQREIEINKIAIDFFRQNLEIKLIGINLKQSDDELYHRIPIYSVQIRDFHYNYVVVLLNDLFGIQSRGGISCASLYAQYLLNIDEKQQKKYHQCIIEGQGMPKKYGWCRITLNYLMNDNEIMFVLNALKYIHEHGHEYLDKYEYNPKKSSFKHKNFDYQFPKLSLDNIYS